jgi:ABC-type branched-subunit amino acid transport system ATPase component
LATKIDVYFCDPQSPWQRGSNENTNGLLSAAQKRTLTKPRHDGAGQHALLRISVPSATEQQLLAIARCLCGKPRLVLLDEPTEGIQPSIIDEIVEMLQRLRDNSGLTMILVEQNLDFIAALSKRILIIQKGTITREVQPGDLGDASLVGEFIGITT